MKRILVTTALLFLLIIVFYSCSNDNKNQANEQSNTISNEQLHSNNQDTLSVSSDSLDANIEKERITEQLKNEEVLIQDAMSALEKTKDALIAFDKNDNKLALKYMEEALGKLDLILARDPNLKLVPVDVQSQIVQLVSDLETIKQTRKEAEKLVKKGHLQAARQLLNTLASEIRISTYNIPLLTYPVAIKLAVRKHDEGDMDEAKQVLDNALNTLVVEKVIIPIPVINAQFMVGIAADSMETNKTKTLELLNNAQNQLELAEALGYGDRDREFRDIDKNIEEIKNKINKDEKATGLLDSLKTRMQSFKERISF